MNLKIALVPATLALCACAAFAQQAAPPAPADPGAPPPPTTDASPQPKKHIRTAPDSVAMSRAIARADVENLRAQMAMIGAGGALHDMDMRIGPSGIWWKNPDLVQKLALTPDQQKRMDSVFQNSRIELIDLKANVEKQNVLLEPMLDANPPDTPKTLAQIDRAAQARADLEKANAHMLLGIRAVLTPDQWTKLQTEEHSHHTEFMLRTPSNFGHKGPGTPQSMMLRIPAIPSIEIPSIQIDDGFLDDMPPLPTE